MVKVQRMGGVVLAAAAVLLAAVVADVAATPLVPVTDKDVESNASLWNLYKRWARAYNVSMGPVETRARFETFKKEARNIYEFNKKGDVRYELGLNQFSALTDHEFNSGRYTGFSDDAAGNVSSCHGSSIGIGVTVGGVNGDAAGNVSSCHGSSIGIGGTVGVDGRRLLADVPAQWDWREHGAVSRVQNQGECGSCWAFAMVGAVEGINAIKTGKLQTLSEQEVIDCSDRHCDGGNTYREFDHAIQHGLALDAQGNNPPYYPAYVAERKSCRFNPNKTVVKIDGKARMRDTTEAELKDRVSKQPVTVAVDADEDFRRYSEGVFTGPCGTRLNHAVLLVGYGTTDDGIDYWIVKNSWGTGWGEDGYIRMKRNVGTRAGLCGIYIDPAYPVKN